MTTKKFCDIAELDPIKKFNKKKIIKGLNNYLQLKQLCRHIITIPTAIIEKIENFEKTHGQFTRETVNTFLEVYKKSKFKINV